MARTASIRSPGGSAGSGASSGLTAFKQRTSSFDSTSSEPKLDHLAHQREARAIQRLSNETCALDPAITRHFLKLYVAFKAETNFVDVVPQKARLRLSLNIPIEALHDERALAWDVSEKGRYRGKGPPKSN